MRNLGGGVMNSKAKGCGNPKILPDVESFLHHILKSTLTAFTRFNAMLLRSNYDPKFIHIKESLQTLQLGCNELRAPGIFLKLLEAILQTTTITSMPPLCILINPTTSAIKDHTPPVVTLCTITSPFSL